ncbi:MAG: helix-turn-helix transcriptional regulator [Devosia sp.]|uniref:winged helix-turn-helix transcriptional regulator n=1 Tax=Devosia sp. TaxID=1871048 RepID=UPI00260C05E3|nr:helix-turn-helix domain-containing protein [Devosia sp.]MDB5542249.1 helix-turn-helix transcriptional regulator [Devosia sp.]
MRQQNRPPVNQAVIEELLTTRNSKWTLTVVLHLRHATMRFSELQRDIGTISQKALTASLRALERDGFVSRTSYATIPPRVDYALTDLGMEALKAFEAFEAFAALHWSRVQEARQLFDARDSHQLEPSGLRTGTGR